MTQKLGDQEQHIWRIAVESKDYPAGDLSGAGAGKTGGRWNSPGTAIVYCSSNIALAALETLAHLRAGALPYNRFLVRVTIPGEIWSRRETVSEPPGGWDALPHGLASTEFGNAWVKQFRSALLCVPSVIIPDETNVLLNPAHPDAAAIEATALHKFRYDPRFF